jgi:amino acid transporter
VSAERAVEAAPAGRGQHHSSAERSGLERRLGRFGLFALAFGSMIGVGWVTAIGSWLSQAGPLGAALAFIIGGALMLCIGLCYAEATPMLPVAGGEVAYAYAASGTIASFVVGWMLAFGYISVSAFEAISVGRVLGFMFPSLATQPLYEVAGDVVHLPHLALAVGCTVLITLLHFAGVRWVAAVQTWLTLAFILIIVLFLGAGFAGGSFDNAQPLLPAGGAGVAFNGLLAVLASVPFWFVGFDTIPQGAEEAETSLPPRLLGTLIVTAVAGAVAFYVLLVASVSMVAPIAATIAAELPAAYAFEAAFQSTAWRDLILVAALIGLFTSWNGFFLAGSRVIFALGRARIIPASFGVTHPRFGTPHNAVLLTGAVTLLAPLLGRSALLAFVDVGSFCIAAAFLGVAVSVWKLRRSRPDLPRPYRVPGGNLVPAVAAAGSLGMLLVMIVPGSPAALAWPIEIAILGAFIILGALFWMAASRTRGAVPESERAYLILEEHAVARTASAQPME